jgi:hypothetical protein
MRANLLAGAQTVLVLEGSTSEVSQILQFIKSLRPNHPIFLILDGLCQQGAFQ